MEGGKKSSCRLIYLTTSGWRALSLPNTTRTSAVTTLSKRKGKSRVLVLLRSDSLRNFLRSTLFHLCFFFQQASKVELMGECFFWLSGVGRQLWWTVFLAVNLWSGSSRWAWLRMLVRRCSMGHVCSRVGCSSTSSRNMTSKTVPFITASWHKGITKGWFTKWKRWFPFTKISLQARRWEDKY